MHLIILHGSRATDHANENSDWDVAVLGDHALSIEERSAVKQAVAVKLNAPEDRVDIADLSADAPLLRYRVAMHGKLIEGNPEDFRRFQIIAWKEYLNSRKLFDLKSAYLEKALR